MRMLATSLMLLLCCSCIQLGGKPESSRYYLLAPLQEVQPARTSLKTLVIVPVSFPSYLDRPQLVSHNSQFQVQIAEFDRWAEPLQENLTRVIQENLQLRFPELEIDRSPWQPGPAQSATLKLVINRFDGVLGKSTEVDIRWILTAADCTTPLQGHFSSIIPIGDSYAELVKGLNRALDELSTQLFAALAKQTAN